MCKQPAVRMFKLEWQRRLTWLCRTANAVCLYTAKCIYDSMEQKCHLVVKVSPNIWSTNFYITHTSSLVHDQKFRSTNLLLASWVKKKWQQVGKFCSPWQELYCVQLKIATFLLLPKQMNILVISPLTIKNYWIWYSSVLVQKHGNVTSPYYVLNYKKGGSNFRHWQA